MTKKISALRGMFDILPDEVVKWRQVEAAARGLFSQYGYEEIRTPIMEETRLFARSIGEGTDIVEKQMYCFKDRGERDVSLRPEGTAPVVRAYLEHGLGKVSPVTKLYYIGPMFRSERPQSGRNRQFHQIGVEVIGSGSAFVDAEIIGLMMKLLGLSGLTHAELSVNSLGCAADKAEFEKILKKALAPEMNRLCPDCVRRSKVNILRVFDCKNESCRRVLRAAPTILDSVCPPCRQHFESVKSALGSIGITYTVMPFLVRGLDYYTGTVFEVTHKNLGSQDAVGAGGRYDNLIAQIGGESTSACGFAVGVERILLAARDLPPGAGDRPDLFIIGLGDQAGQWAFKTLTELRDKGISCQMGFEGKSLKSQMRFADKIRAKRVLIVGEDELKSQKAILRDMDSKQQREVGIRDVANTQLW